MKVFLCLLALTVSTQATFFDLFSLFGGGSEGAGQLASRYARGFSKGPDEVIHIVHPDLLHHGRANYIRDEHHFNHAAHGGGALIRIHEEPRHVVHKEVKVIHEAPIVHHAPIVQHAPIHHEEIKIFRDAPIIHHAPQIIHQQAAFVQTSPIHHEQVNFIQQAPVIHHQAPIIHAAPIFKASPVLHAAPIHHEEIKLVHQAPIVHHEAHISHADPIVHAAPIVQAAPVHHEEVRVIEAAPIVHAHHQEANILHEAAYAPAAVHHEEVQIFPTGQEEANYAPIPLTAHGSHADFGGFAGYASGYAGGYEGAFHGGAVAPAEGQISLKPFHIATIVQDVHHVKAPQVLKVAHGGYVGGYAGGYGYAHGHGYSHGHGRSHAHEHVTHQKGEPFTIVKIHETSKSKGLW